MTGDVKSLPGLSEDDLVALGPCAVCGKPLLGNGDLTFYRLTVDHCAVDIGAIQQRVGLGLTVGNAALARVLSPVRHLAKVVDGGHACVVHESCAAEINHPLELIRDTTDKE